MTVKNLIKILQDMPQNAKVYTADHDHAEWETNGIVRKVEAINQKSLGVNAHTWLEKDPVFKIKGTYVVIGV